MKDVSRRLEILEDDGLPGPVMAIFMAASAGAALFVFFFLLLWICGAAQ